MSPLPPTPSGPAGRRALRQWFEQRSILGALESFRTDLGDIFRMPLPGLDPIVLAGPEANRFVLLEARRELRWRLPGDPVGRLLRNGLLMQDGAAHDELRALMAPSLHREKVADYVSAMVRLTDHVSSRWNGDARDMLVEMRRLTLLILVETLFGFDITGELDDLLPAVLRTLDYIAPGLWLIWRSAPRPGYGRARERLDRFLYGLIAARRASAEHRDDLLGALIAAGLSDDLIRDQMLTMFIAGHDTSTALLAWSLYLLGWHPAALERARLEVDEVLGHDAPSAENVARLPFLGRVIQETLRLYPPIHIGNRVAARDLAFQGYEIPSGSRLFYSIYLCQRDSRDWSAPSEFDPERFAPGRANPHPPLAYIPFGGGPRFCIGASFAQVEARVILARLLQKFDLELLPVAVHPRMGATLEPRPGVWMRIRRQ